MRLYYCLVRMNRVRILSIEDKENLMSEIRYEIIPYLFKNQGLLDELMRELNRETTIEDVWARNN